MKKQENRIADPAYFFKRYRVLWLCLVIATYLIIPLATLAFFGMVPWLSPSAALFMFLASFALHLTVFVAGRWNPKDGFTGLQVKDKN